MMPDFKTGSLVALTQCLAWKGPEQTTISGLYVLVEWTPFEPSAYCWEAGWDLISVERANQIGEDGVYEPDDLVFVSDGDLLPQICPNRVVKYLDDGKLVGPVEAWERDMYFHEVDRELQETNEKTR
jgi:hypothetical protein